MLIHRDDCPRAVVDYFTGNYGDKMVKCRRCKAFAKVEAEGVRPERPARPRGVPPIPHCDYVSRHGDTWPTHRAKARRGAPRGNR